MRLRLGTEVGLHSWSLAISVGLHCTLAALVLLWVGSPKPQAPPVLTVNLVAPDPGPPGPGQGPAPAKGQGGQTASPSAPPAPIIEKASPPPRAKAKPPKRQAPVLVRSEPEEVWPEIPRRPVAPPMAKPPAIPTPAAISTASPAPTPYLVAAPGVCRGGSGSTTGQGREGTGVGSGGTGTAAAGLGAGRGEGTGGGGGGRSPADAQRQYLSVVRTRILAKRQYPLLARQRREEGVVRLRFTLSSGGALAQGVQMVQPSGFQLLDDQAQHCVMAASPFPPFPPDLKRDCLTVEVPIVYKLTELGM